MVKGDVRANHVTQCVVLLQDLESSGIWDFGIFGNFDAVAQPSSIYFGIKGDRNARLLAVFENK